MASYNVTDTINGSLTMLVVDVVTCNRPFRWAVVTNRSLNEIWVRTDAVNPTIGGAECYVVLPGTIKDFNYEDSSGADIRLIASLASTYAVEFI